MAGEIEIKKNNMHLINAPAGSGKTTYIRSQLKNICIHEPKSKILCITYTNRAASELAKDLDSSNITIGTIHSYINNLIAPFYSHKEVIALYWKIYGFQIRERIANAAGNEKINESNQHYREKYGELTEETVKAHLVEISYGEKPFTSLYTGELSHDDLLIFANRLIKEHPTLLRKIGDKYNYIFIDEYQDTSADILDIFYEVAQYKKSVHLYLLGDRMQQIYKNYDGSFEEKLKRFDTSNRLETNFRSIGKIVQILNNIYNLDPLKQKPTDYNSKVEPEIDPCVIISQNPKECICDFQKRFPKILVLYLMNKEKYQEIGAENLYKAYSGMDKYSFGKKYSATDVLSDTSNDNPDILIRFLFLLDSIITSYADGNYGKVISICRNEHSYFESAQFKINVHADKKHLKDKFDVVWNAYEKETSSIGSIITCLLDTGLIKDAARRDFMENAEYSSVLSISVIEVKRLSTYLRNPHISTQHGVKGESYPSVIFMASDNYTTPNVRIYQFFKLWSIVDFSLPEFENLFYSYRETVKEVEAQLGIKTSELTIETHNENKAILIKYSNQILDTYQNNTLFSILCRSDFTSYLAKQTVKNAKKIFNINQIEGILTAYKLFYVGCSRARKNLIIVVDEKKVSDFKDTFIKKLQKIGFKVK